MLSQEIKRKAKDLGYIACGIIPASSFDEYTKALEERVQAFPKSKELYKYFYDFTKQPEDAKSVIVCTVRFNQYKPLEALEGLIAKCYQFDCRLPYAHERRNKIEFETYLKTLGLKVFEEVTVPDRWAAVKAGLGKFGRNNFVYDLEHGSNIWIETWVVDKELEFEPTLENGLMKDNFMSDCIAGCRKCITSCPTKALSDELEMDMGKCITYLFCHVAEDMDMELNGKMQQWVYGCDVCQEVCPRNKEKYKEIEKFPLLDEHARYLTLYRILEMDEDTYKNIILPRFWYAGEDNLWMWKYNALRAMINSKEAKYHRIIKEYCNHENPQIRDLAFWGVETLQIH